MFMDLKNRVFKEYLNMFAIVFIDDILIQFKIKEDHEVHLRKTWTTLKNLANFLSVNFGMRG